MNREEPGGVPDELRTSIVSPEIDVAVVRGVVCDWAPATVRLVERKGAEERELPRRR